MDKVHSSERKQSRSRKKGRPRKDPPSGETTSKYFTTESVLPVPKTTTDLAPSKNSTEIWHDQSKPSKQRIYNFTHKLKSFVTYSSAIPVEIWENFRVDRRNSCGLCGLLLEDAAVLKKHVQKHLLLKCSLCNSLFDLLDSSLFMLHMEQHSPTKSALPCSSAILNEKINGGSYLVQKKKNDQSFNSRQSKTNIMEESVTAQSSCNKSMPILVCDSPNVMNVDEHFPEVQHQEVELITEHNSCKCDGLQAGGGQSQSCTVIDYTDTTENHCITPQINHPVPTSTNFLVCTFCDFQSQCLSNLCKHNRLFHNLSTCICQGNSCSKAGNLSRNLSDDETAIRNTDAKLSVTPSQLSSTDCIKKPYVDTIICLGSPECVVLSASESQKPMSPDTDEVGMQCNKISRVSCTRVKNENDSRSRSLDVLDLKGDDPLNLHDDENGIRSRSYSTAVSDDCVDGVVEVIQDSPKSKPMKRNRKTKKHCKECNADETVCEILYDEPSIKKRKSGNEPNSKDLIKIDSCSQKSSLRNKNRKNCDLPNSLEIVANTPTTKRLTRHSVSSGEKLDLSEIIPSRTNSISNKELKSLFGDLPNSLEIVANTPATKRLTRHSVSSGEKSDLSEITPDLANRERIENCKKPSKKRSPKITYLVKLDIDKCNNVPIAAKINIEILNNKSRGHNKKFSRFPNTVISGKDSKLNTWIVHSTSRTARSRANDKKWRKLLDVTKAAQSNGHRTIENVDDHQIDFVANDVGLAKTPPAAVPESEISDELLSFEVVDVENIIAKDSPQQSYENEANISTTTNDPLALSIEDALDLDSFCEVSVIPRVQHLSSRVLQFSSSNLLFDLKKFSTKSPTTNNIQMEDVPLLVPGQWIVYNCFFRRYNSTIDKVVAFSNKSFYLKFFNSEEHSNILPRDKIFEDHTYFCDYRSGNHTTIPVKFKPFELKLNGSLVARDTDGIVENERACVKFSSPWSKGLLCENSPLMQQRDVLTKCNNEGDVEHMSSEGSSNQESVNFNPNQERNTVQLRYETTHPLIYEKTRSLESCENDAFSVKPDNGTPNDRCIELINPEMEADEKLGNADNGIETMTEKPGLVVQNEIAKSNLEENSTFDDEADGNKSPLLIDGKMQCLGGNNFKIVTPPIFDKIAADSDAGIAVNTSNVEKPSYWGFSDPETDVEEKVITSKSGMNETIDVKKPVSTIPDIGYPDYKTTAKKRSKFSWSGLSKMLKEIDNLNTWEENGEIFKPFSKKSASLRDCHSRPNDIDISSDIAIEHSTEGNKKNISHFQRKIDVPTDSNLTIYKNKIENQAMVCRTGLNKNEKSESVCDSFDLSPGISNDPFVTNGVQQRPAIRNLDVPSCSSVTNIFGLSTGVSDDKFITNQAVQNENQKKKMSNIRSPILLPNCSSINKCPEVLNENRDMNPDIQAIQNIDSQPSYSSSVNTFGLAAGVLDDKLKKYQAVSNENQDNKISSIRSPILLPNYRSLNKISDSSKTMYEDLIRKCPEVFNENRVMKPDIQAIQNIDSQPSSSSVTLNTVMPRDQIRKCLERLKEDSKMKSHFQDEDLQTSCCSVNQTFESSKGILREHLRESLEMINRQKESGIKSLCPEPSCSSVNSTMGLQSRILRGHSTRNSRQIGTVYSPTESIVHQNHQQPVSEDISRNRRSLLVGEGFEVLDGCGESFRAEGRNYPHNFDREMSYCEQRTSDVGGFYGNQQVKFEKADEYDFDFSDESLHYHVSSLSCSSGSSSPDYVDDIILQSNHPREISEAHIPDEREFRDCMSPPVSHQPRFNLSPGSSDSIPSSPFSPTPSQCTLRTSDTFNRQGYSSSSSVLSDGSDGSSRMSLLSPTFSDEYDSH